MLPSHGRERGSTPRRDCYFSLEISQKTSHKKQSGFAFLAWSRQTRISCSLFARVLPTLTVLPHQNYYENSRQWDLNSRPFAYEANAITSMLCRLAVTLIFFSVFIPCLPPKTPPSLLLPPSTTINKQNSARTLLEEHLPPNFNQNYQDSPRGNKSYLILACEHKWNIFLFIFCFVDVARERIARPLFKKFARVSRLSKAKGWGSGSNSAT